MSRWGTKTKHGSKKRTRRGMSTEDHEDGNYARALHLVLSEDGMLSRR